MEQPLVSVFIVTYNSSDFIVETLESVKSQTYPNIELVVSDDGSSDDTIKKVKEWSNINSNRFSRIDIIESSINTGTPANYNRAVKSCKGEWLKMIDGDDIILPNCIADNVNYISKNEGAEVVFSNVMQFKTKNGKIRELGELFCDIHKSFFSLSSNEQLLVLLNQNILPSQSCFISASILKNNPYEEKYIRLEDYPMWLKLSLLGYKFYGFNKITAKYRIGDSTMWGDKCYYKSEYIRSVTQFFWDVQAPLLKKYNMIDSYNRIRKDFLKYDFANIFFNNKRSLINDIFYNIIKVFVKFAPKFHF